MLLSSCNKNKRLLSSCHDNKAWSSCLEIKTLRSGLDNKGCCIILIVLTIQGFSHIVLTIKGFTLAKLI